MEGLRGIAAGETVLPVSPKRLRDASRNRSFCNAIAFSEIMPRQRRSRKGVVMAVVESGPTQVQRVLAKGSIADPFPSLEQARSDPGRLEKIRQVRKLIDERGIKYIFFQQVSVSGHVNGKGVAATQWENVAEAGYQLVYGATADLFVDRHDRYIGIEPEMMWMRKTDDPNDAVGLTKPWCYHINQFEELREIILDVIDYGEQLGITPTYGDHEDSPGQLELNFLFDRAVRTADNLSTYRQICAAVARKHGVIASFMPKPFTGVSANGAHHHFTLVDEQGVNVFYDADGPAKLSEIGLQFMGGILDHYRGLCGVTAPTVNSYKRFWDFGFWAPIYKDYRWQNRTALVRVASGGRFEFRAVDSACNPYLTQAALLKCGLDGIKRKLDPGPPQQRNVYDVLDEGGEIPRVPAHLGEALEALEADEVVRSAMPGRLYDVYMHYKRDEWEQFLAAVTDWEREKYLDILP